MRDAKYLSLIRQLPCLICGTSPCEAAHVRLADARYEAAPTGIAIKPEDWRALPLCPRHHREGPDAQHKAGERDWYALRGIDPLPLCERLRASYERATTTDRLQAMEATLRSWRLKV